MPATTCRACGADATLSEALVEMSRKRLGMTAVVDDDDRLLGLFTDGDLRRTLDDAALDLRSTPHRRGDDAHAQDHRRRRARGRSRAADGSAQDQRRCSWWTSERRVVGALNIHDLLRARVV